MRKSLLLFVMVHAELASTEGFFRNGYMWFHGLFDFEFRIFIFIVGMRSVV